MMKEVGETGCLERTVYGTKFVVLRVDCLVGGWRSQKVKAVAEAARRKSLGRRDDLVGGVGEVL